jgi:hypothetical protein
VQMVAKYQARSGRASDHRDQHDVGRHRKERVSGRGRKRSSVTAILLV